MVEAVKCYSDVHVVGQTIILTNIYDPEQFWFNFMEGAVFRTKSQEKALPPVIDASEYNQRLTRKKIKPEDKLMYIYSSIPQYVLPFKEYRRVTQKQKNALHQSNHAAWDRDENGSLYTTPLYKTDQLHVDRIANVVEGQYFTAGGGRVAFQFEHDMMLYRLTGSDI